MVETTEKCEKKELRKRTENADIIDDTNNSENKNSGDDAESVREALSKEARRKMSELLRCGNERVELAAAKEIISAYSKEAEAERDDVRLEVVIRVV